MLTHHLFQIGRIRLNGGTPEDSNKKFWLLL